MHISLLSFQQKWKRVQPVGQATTRHSGICEWRWLAEVSASDRSAQEFTGDSCLTVEMPRNTLPTHPHNVHCRSNHCVRALIQYRFWLHLIHIDVSASLVVLYKDWEFAWWLRKTGYVGCGRKRSSRHFPVEAVEKNKISGQDFQTAGRDLIGCLWNRWVTCL